jgi:ABC-type multidrug transport system ATPase subunit/pSer/pThr/pTyr-binding forkhead associated (FHA) protein
MSDGMSFRGQGLAETEPPILEIHDPSLPRQEVSLDRASMTIGRRPDNDIVLYDVHVSGHHGRFDFQTGRWYYTDLGSTNGSSVNGKRVTTAVVKDGDLLCLGVRTESSVRIVFRGGEPVAISAGVLGTVHMDTMSLDIVRPLLIGREAGCDIQLEAPVVSRKHARLAMSAGGHVLTDLNSVNGTFVNGERLTGPVGLRLGDVVQIGPFTLVYGPAGLERYSSKSGVRLDGLQLVREVGRGERKKRILNEVDLSIYPREFVTVVGTSGAGKSTLMMALNGFARAEVQVLINGDDLYQHFDLYRTMVGYVPQDDIIHRELTVCNALRYAALLRLPPDTSPEEIEKRIDKVLQDVEMIGQKEQVVNSLSGGQRKRVSIAVELLAEPNLFFLDEPTSGLDPGLEKKMMQTLRRLADDGRTIVLVTHATANIVECDHVCFMAQGRMVYFGPPQEALSFFGVTSGDFAEIYTQLDDPDPARAKRKAAEWEERFERSAFYQQYVADRHNALSQRQPAAVSTEAQQGPRVNTLRQFRVLSRRYLDLVLRDKLLLTVLMAVMPIIGALLLLISSNNWLVGDAAAQIESELAAGLAAGDESTIYAIVGNSQTLLFIMALASVLLGLFSSVYEIVKEKSVYQRERMVCLRIPAYIASKVVVLGVFALVQCLLLMVVVALKVDLPKEGVLLPAPVEMYVTLVLGTMAAILMGLLVSAVVPNVNSVIYLVFLILFAQMIFAGVIFDLPGVANQFSSLTLTRWTMEALGTTADMERLDSLTRTRFQPEPVTEEVTMDVERPSDDWEPVTVVTSTQDITVSLGLDISQTVPMSVPQVSVVSVTQEIEVPVQAGVVRSVPISVPQVSVVTVTQMVTIPIQQTITQTVPMSVPEVTVNEVFSITEVLSESVTVESDPIDIFTERDFHIAYGRTAGHILTDWGFLLAFGLAFAIATGVVLRRKDVG